jgi:ditrans,polycis-polyprenyl diphosphate synthase
MFKYVQDELSSFLKKTISSIFKIGGHVPKSLAIIMDGNRRYASKNKFEKIKGHEDGLSTLLQVLLWCIDLDIRELTVFAFSIDNFNRPQEEINSLLFLAKDKFAKLTEKNEYLNKYGVKVSFYGNLDYFDEELKNSFLNIEKETEYNKNLKLNVCFPYNSTEEIFRSVKRIQDSLDYSFEENLQSNKININKILNESSYVDNSNIYREKLESNLYGGYNCSPDIVIRTSGEVRLSNFLLYQTRFSMIFFLDKYWPEFSFKEFLGIIIRYNINYKSHFRKIKELEKNNNFKIIY